MRLPLGTLVRDPTPRECGVPVSYDWQGARYEWRSTLDVGSCVALDVERLDTPRPKALVPSGWTNATFLAAWTQAEVMCKILGIPILIWIKTNPLQVVCCNRWIRGGETGQSACWTYSGICRPAGIAFTCGYLLPQRTTSSGQSQMPGKSPPAARPASQSNPGGPMHD